MKSPRFRISVPVQKQFNYIRNTLLVAIVGLVWVGTAIPSATQCTNARFKSEFIAPGIEHLEITRGYKSETETTGPWFINMLRFDPRRARLQLVHALDEGVGLETTSSLATRYAALAAVNSGYFVTTGTYRGDSLGVQMLNGTLLSEPHYVRAAAGLIERKGMQELIFGHLKLDSPVIAGRRSKHIDGLNRQRADNELILFTPKFHRTTLTDPDGIKVIVMSCPALSATIIHEPR